MFGRAWCLPDGGGVVRRLPRVEPPRSFTGPVVTSAPIGLRDTAWRLGMARGGGQADDLPLDVRPRELRVVSDDAYADWRAVYEDNVDRIHRLMFAKVGNRADAEDLTAEVFLAALGPMQLDRSVGEVRAYLVATARTVLARHWRTTMGREITTIDQELVAAVGQDDPVSDAPERAAAILEELPERDRRILSLRFLQAYSNKDAALALGVTVA